MAENDIKAILLASPFFSDFSQKYLELIAECGHETHFSAGEFLIREGDEANEFFLIREGDVAIESHVLGGVLTVAKSGTDGVVGFSWLFPPYRTAFDARAVTEVSAVKMNAHCLRAKVESDHEFGYLFMKRFAQLTMKRMQSTRRQMLDIYGEHQNGKFA
jgi:CRP-like cAMP-binding protein